MPERSLDVAMNPPTDALGCAVSRLYKNQEVHSSGITFYRKRYDGAGRSQVSTPPSDRGFLVGVSLLRHRRTIFEGRRGTSHDFAVGSMYLRNFSDEYRAELEPFDFLLLEMSRASLRDTAEDGPGVVPEGLTSVAGATDDVLSNLVRALAPTLENSREASTLFVDQVGLAISTHLLGRYGGLRVDAPRIGRRLSRSTEARAKEFLRAHLDGDIAIAEVATACNLSRSYFISAFRETTGQTPHRWLLGQRVARACELMSGTAMPLAEVALATGFVDQSHLTRVFHKIMGTTPARWRHGYRT